MQEGIKKLMGTLVEAAEEGAFDRFKVDVRDFASAREGQPSAGTEMEQVEASMDDASELLNRSRTERSGEGKITNVISPVVIPKDSRSFKWVVPFAVLCFVGILGGTVLTGIFGPHYWLLVLALAGLKLWQNSYVMIPDGCQALITKFGKLELTVGPGRTWLIDPRKKVGYIVNTTKQFPYNAPIREAPTSGRVNASVDLFLQFQIEDPEHFIFTLGGVNGFAEKLHNAVSELTRSLIYEQKAEAIYDLVGESTEPMLDALNGQFLPAVRFVSANITHAEPSSQEYRMDLAAAEIVRVAKEAYTYQYELQLRKQQDEGELDKELGGLHETLSEIRADIARYQAQIDTAREKEANRANAYAQQLMIEAEAEARANAALLEAQALDIRAVNSAEYPEILEYRFRQQVLDSIEALAESLPRIIVVGEADHEAIDFGHVARQMLGIRDTTLFSEADVETIRGRVTEITARIEQRAGELASLMEPDPVSAGSGGSTPAPPNDPLQADGAQGGVA